MVKNHLCRILEPEYIHLVVWLLDQHQVKRKADPLSALITSTGGNVGQMHDCVYVAKRAAINLEQDLQSTLVFMVTMVVGCQPRTNTLWYSIFAPNELTGTYIPGTLVSATL